MALWRKTKPATSTRVVSSEVRGNFEAIDEAGLGASALAQATPDLTVLVSAFEWLKSDGVTRGTYAGGTSPASVAPSSNPRIAVLAINDGGTLAWVYGAEAASPVAPAYPENQLAIVEVYQRVAMTSVTDTDGGAQGYIRRQPTRLRAIRAVSSQLPRSYLAGLGLANNGGDASNDIDIAPGAARSADDTGDLVLASSLTKRLDALWAVGTAQGGLDTGAKAASTWYHIWAIKRLDTGVVDALFSLSATSPTMPTDYTLKRRNGSVRTDGALAIRAFTQVGDQFLWTTPILDVSGDFTEAATLRTLTVPPNTDALVNVGGDFSNDDQIIYLTAVAQTDAAPAVATALGTVTIRTAGTGGVFGLLRIRVDAARQIRSRTTGTLDGAGLNIAAVGWWDRRGRDD